MLCPPRCRGQNPAGSFPDDLIPRHSLPTDIVPFLTLTWTLTPALTLAMTLAMTLTLTPTSTLIPNPHPHHEQQQQQQEQAVVDKVRGTGAREHLPTKTMILDDFNNETLPWTYLLQSAVLDLPMMKSSLSDSLLALFRYIHDGPRPLP